MHKIGIAGCGKVAHLHAKAIFNLPNVKLSAAWSRSSSSVQSFTKQYQIKAYDKIHDMVVGEGLDLVIVCTPHPFHTVPAIEAMKAGANVLVEKPLASSLKDCDEMINAGERYKKQLGVVSQRRYYEPVMRVRKAIIDGKIGEPALGTILMLGWRDEDYYNADPWRGKWETEGGGVLVNQAPHQLDILLWFMGDIAELYGCWENLNHPYIEVEDTALAIIKFKNGALGNILVSNSQKPGIYGKVHVHGRNGASIGVQTDGGAMFVAGMSEVMEPPVNDLWTVPGEEHLLDEWVKKDTKHFQNIDPTVYYMQKQIEDFLQALEGDRDPMITGVQGRKSVELFTAIYRSNRDGKPLQFPLISDDGKPDFDGRIL